METERKYATSLIFRQDANSLTGVPLCHMTVVFEQHDHYFSRHSKMHLMQYVTEAAAQNYIKSQNMDLGEFKVGEEYDLYLCDGHVQRAVWDGKGFSVKSQRKIPPPGDPLGQCLITQHNKEFQPLI